MAPIECLNEDCLRIIFSQLSIYEKLSARGVCNRWRAVIDDQLATGQKALFFGDPNLVQISPGCPAGEEHHTAPWPDRWPPNLRKIWRRANYAEDCVQVQLKILKSCLQACGSGLRAIKLLDMNTAGVEDDLINMIIDHCQQIECFHFEHSYRKGFKNRSLVAIGEKFGSEMRHLQLLTCFDTGRYLRHQLTEYGLRKFLKSCPKLELVHLKNNGLCTGWFFAAAPSTLSDVALYGFDDRALMALSQSPAKETLTKMSLDIEDDLQLAIIGNHFLNLVHLDITFHIDSRVSQQAVACIRNCSKLQYLRLNRLPSLRNRGSSNRTTDALLLVLMKHCPDMCSLDLYGGQLSDASVSQIPMHWPHLQNLKLCSILMEDYEEVTNNSCSKLARLSHLTQLIIEGGTFTEQAVKFFASDPKDVETESDTINDTPVQITATSTSNIRKLYLASCNGVKIRKFGAKSSLYAIFRRREPLNLDNLLADHVDQPDGGDDDQEGSEAGVDQEEVEEVEV